MGHRRPRHVPIAWCDLCGKEAMPTWVAAEARGEGIRRSHREHMSPYPCPHGQGFHLTSKPRDPLKGRTPKRKDRRGR